jgi:HEAT repeat protein
MDAPPSAPRYPAWLGLASFAWAVAGWVLAASAPRLAFVPVIELLHLVLPGVTAALILANLAFSLHALFRRKVPIDRLLLVTGLQIGLFTTLFFQFAAHLGADCYSIQRPTRSWEWVQFSVAHAVRAADVLDAIEAYGWDIQVIKHRGPFVASVIVLYHIVIDLFVLGLFWAMTRRLQKRLMEKPGRVAVVFLLGALAFLGWFGVWMAFAMEVRPWRPIDVPLWFAENVVRVVDFADAMDSFDIHWHQVPAGPVESTLTFFCRLWIAIAISLFLNWRMARKGVRPPVVDARPISPWSLARLGVAVVLIAAVIGVDSLLEAGTSERVAGLADAATGDDPDRARQALAEIRRLGPNARDAIGPLNESRSRFPARSARILETLGHLGPDAIEPLREVASGTNGAEAVTAVASLRRIGPKAAPALVAIWGDTRGGKTKAVVEAGLRDLGVEAMPALIEATDMANSADHLHWFDELDRNWTLRGSDNPTFLALRNLRAFEGLVRTTYSKELPERGFDYCLEKRLVEHGFRWGIGDSGVAALPILGVAVTSKNRYARRYAVECVGSIGPLARGLVPRLIVALKDDDVVVRRLAVGALGEIGPDASEAVPGLARVMRPTFSEDPEQDERAEKDPVMSGLVNARSEKDPLVRRLAAGALGKIGPGARRAEQALVKALADEDRELRIAAAHALAAIRPRRGRAVVALSKALADENGDVRRAAATALGMIGPQARKALPELTKLSEGAGTAGSVEAKEAIERIRRE